MKHIPRGIPCLIVVLILFGYLSSVMGLSNMLNTIMHTAHDLLLNTVFYLMGICVLTGALGRIFSEFGVVDLLQKILRPVMRPLYNMPGVAVLASVMTFLSDNPAIISLTKNQKFASYFKRYQFISLTNFGTAFGMGLLVIVFMIGQGYFGAPFIGLIGAAIGGIVATRMMQFLILREHPEYRDQDVVLECDDAVSADLNQESGLEGESIFTRVLNSLLDGGKSGVEIGLAIIPGVLIICTFVMMFTFGGTVEGIDENGQDIIVYTGEAYQGTQLLPWLASKISIVFQVLFGFESTELVAFPITSLGAVGAALSLIPELISKGIMDGNAVAVFTAMGMCWSGFLSSHTAMLDSLKCRHLLTKDVLSQICGGLTAGIVAHWLYVAVIALSTLFTPSEIWKNLSDAMLCNNPKHEQVMLTMMEDSTFVVHDWYGVKGSDLVFKVNAEDSTIVILNSYAQNNGHYFVDIDKENKFGDVAYASLYPGSQYSEYAGNKQGGYMYVFMFLHDHRKRIIDRGYYEIVWGNGKAQTTATEEIIRQEWEAIKDSVMAATDSLAQDSVRKLDQ